MANILAIDDEIPILELIKNGLQKDGHTVSTYPSVSQIPLEYLNRYDLIMLDIMMPDTDGFTFCKKIRSLVDCPILFLTAKTLENDITFGLGIGADDYLTKPFRIAELRARVNAHLRRETREKHSTIVFEHIKVDLSAKEIRVDDCPVPFTKSEYLICEYLANNKGQVFSKEQIYEAVFSIDGDSDNSTISTHIKNVRAKFNKMGGTANHYSLGDRLQMGTKIATLRTAFIKYLVMLIGSLALSVITPFLIFTIFASLGIVNYANQSEEFVKTIAPVLASTPDLADVTENMPPGCDYLLLDKSYTILETSLKNDDVKSALRYATDGVNTANNGKQFLLITRDKELIVLQYYIGSRFINPWLNKYFPSPEMILYSLIALNCVFVCILLTIRFSRRLQKQLVPIMNATEEISSQNLDFEIGHSNIKEFEDVLLSFSKMRDDLKMSLEKQWHAEQLQREQIAALAHDLKTPLTVIQGNIDLINETELDDEQRLYADYITESSSQISIYIKTLIDISRTVAGYQLHLEEIDISGYMGQIEAQANSLCFAKGICLHMEKEVDLGIFKTDKLLLERAIMNVISNAVDYSPPLGTIYVTTQKVDHFLHISITDEGTGFTSEAIHHAQEQFFMGDKSRTSNMHFGMGLYITNSIIKQHDGQLILSNSKKTGGAQVIIKIPY